jgi:hypothetical protein
MSNTLLTRQEITRETLMILKNNTIVWSNVYHGYKDEFGKKGQKIGSSLKVRKPARFVGGDGAAYTPEALTDTYVPVTLDQWSKVHFDFSSDELYLSLDDFSSRYLKPAAIALANKLDRALCVAMYQNFFNTVGVPGTIPSDLRTYLQAGQKLDEMGTPSEQERTCVVNAAMRVEIIDALKGLFQDSAEVAKQYRTGRMGKTAGLTWYQDQNIKVHTVGTYVAQGLVNGASEGDDGIVASDGWGTGAASLHKGDIITIAGVYAVNPQNRETTGSLQQFVITSDIADTTGAISLPISPTMVSSGQFQNVTNLPADNAQITILGASGTLSAQGLVFTEDSFAAIAVPMDLPTQVEMAHVETDPDTGLSLRFVRQYLGAPTDLWINRLDVLWGVAPLYAEKGCRVAS